MVMESLLAIGVLIAALPLLGSMLAMTLGIMIALSRRAGGIAALDRVEPPLRRVTVAFGCTVEGARTIPDRREGERRARARQRYSGSGADRRRRDRRLLERRALDRRHERRARSRR